MYSRNVIAFLLISLFRLVFKILSNEINPGKNILFVNLGLLGDTVMNSVILVNEEILSDEYNYSILVCDKYRELFRNYFGKINIIYMNKSQYKTSFFYRINLLKKLTMYNFKSVYNLSFGRRAIDDEVSIISGINGLKFAFPNNKNIKRLLDNKIDDYYSQIMPRNPLSDIQNYASCLKGFIRINKVIINKTKIFPHWIDITKYYKLDKNRYFVVSPYSSWPIKDWSKEKYQKLIKKISSDLRLKCVIVGEKETTKHEFFENTINLMGKTSLTEVINIINDARFFVGNDSGLLHIAKACETTTFGIIGGGATGRVYPYSSKDKTKYFYKTIDCFGCDWICKFKSPHCLSINDDKLIQDILDLVQAINNE